MLLMSCTCSSQGAWSISSTLICVFGCGFLLVIGTVCVPFPVTTSDCSVYLGRTVLKSLTNDEPIISSRFRQSFEQNPVNFASKNYKSYLDPVDAYKPSDRHLQLYNNVVMDDATSTQENPFASQNSLDQNDVMAPSTSYARPNTSSHARPRLNIQDLPSHTAAVEAGLYPQHYRLSETTNESSSDHQRSGSTLPRNNSDVLQHTAQIEYDHSVAPLDVNAQRLNGFHGYNQDYSLQTPPIDEEEEISPRSSVNCSENSYNNGELSSFKVGSTTQLVPSSAHGGGAANNKSLRSLGKGSGNVSFVDNSPTNSMYSSMTSQVSADVTSQSNLTSSICTAF